MQTCWQSLGDGRSYPALVAGKTNDAEDVAMRVARRLVLLLLFGGATLTGPSGANPIDFKEFQRTGPDVTTFRGGVGTLAWSPRGDALVANDVDGNEICLRAMPEGNVRWCRKKIGTSGERYLAFSPDGSQVVVRSISSFGTMPERPVVSILNAATGALDHEIIDPDRRPGSSLGLAFAISPSGVLAVILGETGRVALYDTKTWELLREVDPPRTAYPKTNALGATFLAVSANADTVIVGFIDGVVEVWDVAQNAIVSRFKAHVVGLSGMYLDQANNVLFTAGDSSIRNTRIFEADGSSSIRHFEEAHDELGCVPIAPTTVCLIQAAQEGLDHGGLVLAERSAMGGYRAVAAAPGRQATRG